MADATLIVGAGGFVGRALITALCSSGIPVIAGVRRPINNLPKLAKSYVINYRNPDSIQKVLKKCTSVIYVASDTTPISTAGDPLAELDLNLGPLLTFLEQLENFETIPLLYISSAGSLYSGTGKRLLRETDLPEPCSYHGAAKVSAEHFIGAWCRQNATSATIIRPTNIYGPGQKVRKGFGIIPTAFYAALRSEPITVRGDGRAARDYLYIDDLTALCIAALRKPQIERLNLFHAGTGVATSINDLLALIEDVTGTCLERNHVSAASVDANQIAIDPRRATATFGWLPTISLRDGLERTWKCFLDENHW